LDSPFFFEAITYWSEGDERAHFEWLSRIECVRDVKGRGTRVFLDIDLTAVTSEDIRELRAIYHRYGGDEAQLASLKGSEG
jgi:hypothetical protein